MPLPAIARILVLIVAGFLPISSPAQAALPGLTEAEEESLTFEEFKALRDLILKDIPFGDKETVHTFVTGLSKPGDPFVDEQYMPRFNVSWQKWDLRGVPPFWLSELADKGDPFAQANRGYEYIAKKDWCLGQYWLAQAARKSHTGAMYWVALAYSFGFGVDSLAEGRKNAYLWSLLWPKRILHSGQKEIDHGTEQYGIDTIAERLKIDDVEKAFLVELFESLDISELPIPQKTSCPFDEDSELYPE